MKKSLFYLFALICSISLFTACSDDDDNGGGNGGDGGDGGSTVIVDETIVGSYMGSMDVFYEPDTEIASDLRKRIAITKSSDAALGMSLEDFSIDLAGTTILIGDVSVSDCPVTLENGIYSFTGESTQTLVVGECDITLEGTIQNGNVEITIHVSVAGGAMQVRVEYTGSKLTGNESSEALITGFSIDSDVVSGESVIDNEAGTITFKVLDTVESLTFAPVITVSDGATVDPASGVEQDFTNPVTYTVTAQDGTTKTYTVSRQTLLRYSFEEWGTMNGTSSFPDTKSASWDSPLPLDQLASANEGVAALKTSLGGGYTGEYAMTKETNGYKGNAVKLQTLYTNDLKELVPGSIPAITPASLYTGTFEFSMQTVAAKQLEMTKFGFAYDKKPLKFKGAYKYAQGDNYIDGSQEPALEHQNGEDRGLIVAVLYEVESESETLNGTNLMTAPNRVLIAQVGGSEGVADTQDWTEFEVDFTAIDGQEYSADKNYKLAIVCQSSINGSQFKGAAGSTLWVDELEVIGE